MSAIIVNADCIDFLRSIPDESAGLVIADPPYNIGFTDRSRVAWDAPRPAAEYLDWCREWTREAARILRPGRMLVVWGTLRGDLSLRYRLDILAASGLVIQNEIIWSYNWGRRKINNFARKHEVAWCASKGADFLFNGDDVRVLKKMQRGGFWAGGAPPDPTTIPTCVWEANNHTTSRDHVTWHPSPKNLLVTERMVRAWSARQELVVDPFTGSGTTAVAAVRSGRRFLGCDAHSEYVHRATARVTASVQTAQLELASS